MKIGEARNAYATQLKTQRNQRAQLLKEQKEYQKRLEQSGMGSAGQTIGSGITNVTGVTLELSEEYRTKYAELQEKIDILTEQIEKNEKGLDDVIEMEVSIANMISAEQQGDAMADYAEDVAKCMEIARRISRGDKVPAQDEKKLMEFNMELYQMAKSMSVMNMNKKRKEWESLWEEEEEKEYEDPIETARNSEIDIAMPEGVDYDAGRDNQKL